MCLSRSDSVLLCSHMDTQGPKLTLSFKMAFGEKIKHNSSVDSNCSVTLGLVYKKLNSQNANVTNSNVNDSIQ